MIMITMTKKVTMKTTNLKILKMKAEGSKVY